MNHAVFDLANLSVNCDFDEAADHRLLTAYDGDVSVQRLAQLALMKVMSEMREGMWAVVQQAISTLTHVDFVEYAATGSTTAASCAPIRGSRRGSNRRATTDERALRASSTFRSDA